MAERYGRRQTKHETEQEPRSPRLIALLVAETWADDLVVSSGVSLASDPSGERHVPRHDGDPFGVDAGEVGVLEQPDEVRLGPLLQRLERRRLKPGGDITLKSCITDLEESSWTPRKATSLSQRSTNFTRGLYFTTPCRANKL